MKTKKTNVYDSDRDTERVRRQAGRFSYLLSFGYLIFMFILSRLMKFPMIASAAYPAVIVIGSFLFFCKKVPRKIYEYWFIFSATGLCVLYAFFSGDITVPLLIYFTSLCLIAMFRDEKLIFVDMILGLVFSAACFLLKYDISDFADNKIMFFEFSLIPICIYSAYYILKNLVKRDKQLFLFSQQKNRNNLTLLQIVEAKREEAETAAKVKTEFLANTSHEIRTPMNSIMGMTELALREDASPQIKSYLGNIRDAGTNLLNIINDILDFSKIESSKTELSFTDYNILSVMNDVCNIISIKMNTNAIQLITCIGSDVPSVMNGDERRIKQIILNLAGNAIKYTRHGSITVSISIKPTEDSDSVLLCCSVKDTGIGIREADMKRLFNAFERADTKKNRNIEGTGLGLAICKSLTELMGGKIDVRSIYGAGSVFSFEIPQTVKDNTPCIKIKDKEKRNILLCVRAKEQATAVSAELASLELKYTLVSGIKELSLSELSEYTDILIDYEEYSEHKHLLSDINIKMAVISEPGVRLSGAGATVKKIYRPVTVISLLTLFSSTDILSDSRKATQLKHFSAPDAKILVVDDNATNLLVAKRLLSLYQANVDTAESGIQALKTVQKEDYDIVFMDHMMPELDGIETAQAIRSLGGKYAKLTIIALTANVVSGAAELFRESGMDDFLGKPIEMSELHRLLLKYIPEEKQQRAVQTEEAERKTGQSAFLMKLKEIDGINVDTALNQCGGDERILSDVLRSAASTPSVRKLCKAYESNDLINYTVYVHGLKGALRNVGMEGLGNMAYELELAGKKKDMDFIHVHHEEFINAFNEFSCSALKITEHTGNIPQKRGDPDKLYALLSKLIVAAEDMDYNASSDIIKSLENKTYGENTDSKLRRLQEAVESFDFSEAAELAAGIREEIK